jgi:hypothetical protein
MLLGATYGNTAVANGSLVRHLQKYDNSLVHWQLLDWHPRSGSVTNVTGRRLLPVVLSLTPFDHVRQTQIPATRCLPIRPSRLALS